MPELLLGIDIGTGSSKAVLADPSGTVLSNAVIEHETSSPHPGWHEHDADRVWWSETVQLCQAVFDGTRYSSKDVAAMAVSAIGPCLLPLDKHDQPLRPGILYGVDTRSSDQVDRLTAEIGAEAIRSYSHMDLSSQAIVPKMEWIRQTEPDVWARTMRVTTASSYVVFRLTGEHRIDPHQAAHFMPFMDLHTMTWSDALTADLHGFEMLPDIAWPADVAGTLTNDAARATGLRPGIPVAVGTVDAASEAIGVGVHRPGDLMIMYGSTMFFILITEEIASVPGAWLVGGLEQGQYNVAAGMATAGSLTEWVRMLTSPDSSRSLGYAELFAEAAGIAAGSEGLLVVPYFEGERTPISDPLATGVIAGLGLRHGRGHLMRAVLEGVAYGARHNIEAMQDADVPIERVVAVGGGTTTSLWTQIVSDVGGFEQIVPSQRIGASYGDAFIAGLASGLLQMGDIESWTAKQTTIEPIRSRELYDESYSHYQELYAATAPIQHSLRKQRLSSLLDH